MKAQLRVLVTGVVLATTMPATAQEGGKISTEVSLDFSSKYVWHGINLVNDWVFQPGVSFSNGGFTLGLWGNLELTGWNEPNYTKNPRGRFTEIDTSFEYASTLGKAGWTAGIIEYQYPGTGWERYQEWYGGVSFEETWGSPSLTVYTGNNNRTGTYATLGLSHSLPAKFGKAESIDLGLELNYGDSRCCRFLYGSDAAAMSDVHLSAGTTLEVGKGWSFSPTLHYATLLGKSLLAGAPRRANIWVSCSFGFKF